MAAPSPAVCITSLALVFASAPGARAETGTGQRCLVHNHVCSTVSACTDPQPDPPVRVLTWKAGTIVLTNQAGHETQFHRIRPDAQGMNYASNPEVTPTRTYLRYLTLDRHGNLAVSSHEIDSETGRLVEATVLTAYCDGKDN